MNETCPNCDSFRNHTDYCQIFQADPTIAISKAELDELRRRDFKLTCLENGGVDNWDWYDDSLEPYGEAIGEGEI